MGVLAKFQGEGDEPDVFRFLRRADESLGYYDGEPEKQGRSQRYKELETRITHKKGQLMPTPYLTFDGTTREAFAFYAKVLGGEMEFSQTFGESPMKDEIPAEYHDRIMHAVLRLPDGPLMASDTGPWAPFEGPMRSCSLSLDFKDLDKARSVFDALREGGTVTMPFDKTFWAAGFGMLKDRFGVAWIVNCD